MIEQIAFWVELLFLCTTAAAVTIFYITNGRPKSITLGIIAWSILHSILAFNGFYQDTASTPPRFTLILLPATLFVIFSLTGKRKDKVVANRNIRHSTFIHSVRLPVEIVLHQLFLTSMIPELMTFEGRNFDILAGISAPLVGFLYLKDKLKEKGLLIWNSVCLCLVTFILINGILSAELPFQQFAFDQPNRAISFFPFILLPSTIVPLVIWTHLSDIILLSKKLRSKKSTP